MELDVGRQLSKLLGAVVDVAIFTYPDGCSRNPERPG